MKAVLWCVLWFVSPVWADIYKAVDANGHVTYSSSPIKGGKRVVVTPSASQPATHTDSPHDFPKVNQETQKGRDESRRKILEDELKSEEALLLSARQSQQAALSTQPKDDAKLPQLAKQVELHQDNIAALKTELAKRK